MANFPVIRNLITILTSVVLAAFAAFLLVLIVAQCVALAGNWH